MVGGKLSTNVYVINTCCVEIMDSNGSFRTGMCIIFYYFHFPVKRCGQTFRDHDFSYRNQVSTANITFEAANRLGNMTG